MTTPDPLTRAAAETPLLTLTLRNDLPHEERVTRWRCPHCRKSYGQRGSAAKHMLRCFLSPFVRSCKTCRWFDLHQPEPEVGIMDAGYECHAADDPTGPEEDVNLHVHRCSTCGGEVYPDGSGNCSCDPLGPIAKPVFGLRVQCPFWQSAALAAAIERQET